MLLLQAHLARLEVAHSAAAALAAAAVGGILLAQRLMAFAKQPGLRDPAVDVLPGEDFVFAALAQVPERVDAAILQRLLPGVPTEMFPPAVETTAEPMSYNFV